MVQGVSEGVATSLRHSACPAVQPDQGFGKPPFWEDSQGSSYILSLSKTEGFQTGGLAGQLDTRNEVERGSEPTAGLWAGEGGGREGAPAQPRRSAQPRRVSPSGNGVGGSRCSRFAMPHS